MRKMKFWVGMALMAGALSGCGSSSSADEGGGKEVKELPATAPVTSDAQKQAQEAVAKDPKAETPRADGK